MAAVGVRDVTTVSRWERGIAAPSEMAWPQIEKTLRFSRRQLEGDAPLASMIAEEVAPYHVESADMPGWMFGDPSEAEAQFTTLLKNWDRTLRAMVGTPDAMSREDVRMNQLAICRAAMKACETTGRPVPEFVTRIYNELIAGTFR